MASRYKFTEEQIQELAKAAKTNKRKDVDGRLRALMMRSKGKTLSEVAQATGYSFSNITKLVRTYREKGLAAIVENHYNGNHRNMSYEEETALLKPFSKKAEAGQIVEACNTVATTFSIGRSSVPAPMFNSCRLSPSARVQAFATETCP